VKAVLIGAAEPPLVYVDGQFTTIAYNAGVPL
jgi:hypothetical protein